MSSEWLTIAAIAIGVLVGVGFMIMFRIAEDRGQQARRLSNSGIPEGVEQILEGFETAGIVVDPSNNVLRVTEEAINLGLLTKKGNLRPEINEFVDAARRADDTYRSDVLFAAEGVSSPRRLSLRGARIGARYLVVLVNDRSEEDRLEEVRRDFVANISHELKTPTASVRLIAEAMERAADDPATVRRFSERLAAEAERLAHITAEVIELSRLQSADPFAHRMRLDIADIVQAAVHENEIVAHDRGVEMVVAVEPGLRVDGDPHALRTAVSNLISNAIAYSDDKGRVGVGASLNGGNVEISVTDRGIGMDPAELDRIFERFYRIDQARSRNTGGSGLGLSIVKHIAHNHGGHVRAWSQPGKGSTFTIRIPAAPIEESS